MLQSVSTEDIKTVVVAIYVVKGRISSVDVPVVFGYDGRVPAAIVVHYKSYGKIFKIHCEQAETPTLPCHALRCFEAFQYFSSGIKCFEDWFLPLFQ